MVGPAGSPAGGGHTAAALEVLRGLDIELAENAEELGEQLAWSAAERTVRELIAAEIDRKVWLSDAYRDAGDDVGLRVRLATELRLTEQAVARLLKQVKTDLPPPFSRRSQKAQQAARARWDRA